MSTIACPVCGRRISTSGAPQPPTYCPACGASLLATDQAPSVIQDSHDDSETRPVPLEQFPTRPASPSPAPAAGGGETGATRDLPASALFPPEAASAKRRVTRGLSGLSMLALAVLLLAIVAVTALAVNGALPFTQRAAGPTATAALASPSVTPASIAYTRPGLYRIVYPTGWLTKEQNTPPDSYWVLLYDPRTGASINIALQRTPVYLDAATIDTNYLDGLAAPTGTKATNISKPTAITLAGQTWTEESADVEILNANGKQYADQYAYAVAITANHGGYVYTIVRLVPVSSQAGARSAFAAADQASFQPALATFTFLS